jgi:hypothetical protein
MQCSCGFTLGTNVDKELKCPGCGTVHFVARKNPEISPSPRYNTGENLASYLSWFGKPDDTCNCQSHVKKMNQWGPDGCEKNKEQIVGWILTEAEKRGWPTGNLSKIGVRLLIDKAIKTSRS